MSSEIIRIAIDLGTTNSSVVVNHNGKMEIIKNTFGEFVTPSVFGVDKGNNLVVGKRAYEKLFRDNSATEEKNYKAEVKRIMGTKESISFPRLMKTMSPEDISAEILKALKSDALRKFPDLATAAVVVTIPAHFSTVQAEATKRAAQLAGFDHVVLLQEPIAAAISYGFGADQDHNWLVYDLGGGTFDVAVISSQNGTLRCVTHCGDNFLGGKDFDQLIVDNIFIPHLTKEFSITNFNRGNPDHHWKFSKLKFLAESAKIYLTESESTAVELDGLGIDDNGKEISSIIEFTRSQLNTLIDPLLQKTLELSKKVIIESGLNRSSIDKVVLVGGPTQIPYLRSQIQAILNLAVDTSVDPLTAVAHGACIFASSQVIPQDVLNAKPAQVGAGSFPVTLHFDPMTGDLEEIVSGIVDVPNSESNEYFVQIQSEDGFFSSPKIPLKNNKFYHSVPLQPKKSNLFWIYLLDSKGRQVGLSQDSFSITHGLSVAGAPLPHSIGVGIIKKEYGSTTHIVEVLEMFFNKNSTLPLSQTHTFKTVRPLSKGDNANGLPIKVYEGESPIPDRNQMICQLEINGSSIPFDLPEGADVDITIKVDVSRTVTVEAYIPTVDLRLNARATVHAEDVTLGDLETELNTQVQRAEQIAAHLESADVNNLKNQMQHIRTSLKNSAVDEDEKRKASKMLKDLKSSLDATEKDKRFSTLKHEFDEIVDAMNELFDTLADSKEIQASKLAFAKIKKDGHAAILNRDKELLSLVNAQIESLKTRVLFEDPGFLVHHFKQFEGGEFTFTDKSESDYFLKKGRKAIEFGDMDELRRSIRNLCQLLSPQEKAATTFLSGITK